MDNNTFQSDDLLIASYLLVKQRKLLDIVPDSPRHFIFVFEDFDMCESLMNEYLNNGIAPARELFARREELISAMRHRNGNKTYGNQGR